MILDEPWMIAADRHRSGKATTVLNISKTVVASQGAARFFLHSYGNRISFLRIRVAVVEVFVAFVKNRDCSSYGFPTGLL